MEEEDKKEEVKTGRDLLLERMKSKYPDDDFDDDENLYSRINEDYDNTESELSALRDGEEKLSSLFSSDPRSAAFLSEWSKGGDPLTMLVRMMGETTLRDLLDDPDKLEEIAASNKEYLERVAKNKELEEEYEQNLSASLELMQQLQEEKGYSEEEVDQAMQLLVGIVQDGVNGKFTEEAVSLALKAIHHDKDVEEAATVGEIKGRNAKIEAKMKAKKEGDGTAVLSGSSPQVQAPPRRKTIFDLAKEAQ